MKNGSMKKLLVIAALVLLLGSAAAVRVMALETEIVLDKEGSAHITEKYKLGFFAGELERFRADSTENGSSLLSWQVDYNWFMPHFEAENVIKTYITFDEDERSLFLEYDLGGPFAELVREEPRASVWRVPDRRFGQYIEQGTVVIPQATKVTVRLPAGSSINTEKLLHEAVVSNHSILLSGITSSYINIEYSIAKPIAQPLDLLGLVGQANTLLLISIVAALAIVLYIKRKPIAARVENYIIEHSKIEPSEEAEEEVEIEA